MPIVPMPSGPSVREDIGPNVRVRNAADSEAFGGGQSAQQVFQAGSQVADLGFKMAVEEKQKADNVAFTDARNQTIRAKNDAFWNPKTGVMTRKGKDAFGVPEEYGAQFDKTTDDIENSLSNEAQKTAYRSFKEEQKTQFMEDINKHVFQEGQKFQAEVSETGLVTEREDAVLNYSNPGKVQSSIENQKAIIMDQANREGRAPEWVKEKIGDAESKTHASVLDRMLANGQDQAASEYYKTVKDQIGGGEITKVEKALEEGTLRGQSQRETDKIVSSHDNMSTALDEARKIEDPKLRDETTTRIKDFYNTQRQAKNESKEQDYVGATNIIEKTKNFDNVPPGMLTQMSPAERTSLRNYADNLREGKKPVTNWDEFYNLKSTASSQSTRQKFMQTNLMEYRPELADAEFKELVNLQTQMRNGDDKAEKTLDGYRTDGQIVNDSLNSAGIDSTPKPGSEDSKKVNQFRRKVDEKIAQHQQNTGKKATNEEIQGIVDTMMVEGVSEKGWFWDTKKRLFELQPGESIEIGVDDVPAGERSKIEAALKKNGMPVNNENIVKLFSKKINKKGQPLATN